MNEIGRCCAYCGGAIWASTNEARVCPVGGDTEDCENYWRDLSASGAGPPSVGAPSVSVLDFGPVQGAPGTEPYTPTAEDYAAMENDGIIPQKLRARFKLTLKAPYDKTHPLARQPGNLSIYVYGEETDDTITTNADIDVDQIVEIERAGFYDPSSNTIVDDPEPSFIEDRQISA